MKEKKFTIKEMNDKIFLQNLQNTIDEIFQINKINPGKCIFRINPVVEKGKSMQATDEIMRLLIINPDRVVGKKYSINEVVKMMTCFSPFVSIWIDVKLCPHTDNEAEFQLDCRLRLRKPSLLRNQENGYTPFKAVVILFHLP